jgi:hypothetical protein
MRRLALALTVTLAACGGSNSAPKIMPIDDQVAEVGVELTVQIRATDADNDPLSFDFAAPSIPDLKTRSGPATIASFADGVATFRWTPTARDRSDTPYTIDFKVSDGTSTAVETVRVTVTDAGTGNSPIFRQPLGTGTTLDLTTATCVDVDLVVEDNDSPMVTLAEQPPGLGGAMLTATGNYTATWHWCPTMDQIAAQDRYMVTWTADDGSSPTSLKQYLIVLRKMPKTNCTGSAPVIMHTQLAAQATVQDLKISATVTDDIGLKDPPIVYYATTPPAAGALPATQVTMVQKSGTPQNGVYEGTIPNPVASSPSGTMKTLYYLIAATDADDPTGSCNHTTQAPTTGTYMVTVTNPGATTGLGLCAACTSDTQCGGASDNCIKVGPTSTYCGQACGDTGSPACPTGYTCSAAAILSVDGLSKRQCVPMSNSCDPVMMMACTDDTFEPNDSRTTITNSQAMSMAPGTYQNLVLCPVGTTGANEDWFGIPVSAESTVTAKISFLVGVDYSDLDMQLVDNMGNVLDRSYGTTSTESVTGCIPASAGKVYARVFTFDAPPVKQNLYDLTITRTANNCSCTDANEPDNNRLQAEPIGTPLPISPMVKTFTNLKICSATDTDWTKVALTDGQKIVIDMNQKIPAAPATTTPSANDLDIHLYKLDATVTGGARDLTPCSLTDVTSCQTSNGQGSDTHEHMEYTVPTGMGDTYFVVIKPFDMGTNTYDLSISIVNP